MLVQCTSDHVPLQSTEICVAVLSLILDRTNFAHAMTSCSEQVPPMGKVPPGSCFFCRTLGMV